MKNDLERAATDACCSACASTAKSKAEDAHAVARSFGDETHKERKSLDELALHTPLSDQTDRLSPQGESKYP